MQPRQPHRHIGHSRFCLSKKAFLKKLCTLCIYVVAMNMVALDAAAQQPAVFKESPVVINDTTTYTLKLALNQAGQPQYYFCNVFTPVCLTGECKPVYINFYWDLLGNYTRFDFPPGEVLTKMDHKEFKPEDYEKLQGILSNTNSLLKDVSMADLVGKGTENLADSVDAKAGATLKTVKNEVIDGAVYTCFTLWHIAHGKVVDEMQRITETYKTDALLHQFLASNNHHYQYWAMDRVMATDGTVKTGYEPELLNIIRGKNIFTARYALQKMAPQLFTDETRQRWLWETYQSASYPLQLAILKKLATIPLQPLLTEQVAHQLTNTNQEQTALLLKLLDTQSALSAKTQLILAGHLANPNQNNTAEIYRVLEKRHPKARAVQQKMTEFTRTLNQN